MVSGSLVVTDDWSESSVVVGALVVGVVPATDAAIDSGLRVYHHVGVVKVVSNEFCFLARIVEAGHSNDPEVGCVDLGVHGQVT